MTTSPPDTPDTTLPDELLYAEGGHASDVVLTCLADGEAALVPEPVRAHVLACPECSAHLGNAALLSLRSDVEVKAHVARARAVASGRPTYSPYGALALGLLVAVVGATPRLAALPEELSSFGKTVAHGGPSFLHLVRELVALLVHAADERGALVSVGTASVLVTVALWVARRSARSHVSV